MLDLIIVLGVLGGWVAIWRALAKKFKEKGRGWFLRHMVAGTVSSFLMLVVAVVLVGTLLTPSKEDASAAQSDAVPATAEGNLAEETAPAASVAAAVSFADVVQGVDQQAVIRGASPVIEVVTSAQRVAPHEAPYTSLISALCAQPAVLAGLDKVVVLNSLGVKGVEFWHYDDHDDLAGACEAIAGGAPAGAFAVMR